MQQTSFRNQIHLNSMPFGLKSTMTIVIDAWYKFAGTALLLGQHFIVLLHVIRACGRGSHDTVARKNVTEANQINFHFRANFHFFCNKQHSFDTTGLQENMHRISLMNRTKFQEMHQLNIIHKTQETSQIQQCFLIFKILRLKKTHRKS